LTVRTRAAVGIVLIVTGLSVHAYRIIVPPSELAQKGVRTTGQVLFKDSRPGPDKTFTYTVTFVFADANQRNYQVSRSVPDKGVWDNLKTGSEVPVLYMPERPEEASIAGAEGLLRPRDAAYAYIAWSAILAGSVLLVLAFRAVANEPATERVISGKGRT